MFKIIHQMRKREQGFTLIELLIVVAIIAILAAVAIPQYQQYRFNAQSSACMSEVATCVSEAAAQFANNGDTTVPASCVAGGVAITITAGTGALTGVARACPNGQACSLNANGQAVCL